jgi:putative flippase GtrA
VKVNALDSGNLRTFTKYVVVGGVNTVFGYGIFALLIYFGFAYPVALFIATVLGIAFNFKSTGIFVFRSHDNKLIFRFVAVYFLIYLINLIGLKILSEEGLGMYYAAGIMLPIMALVGFIANKKLVFRK